VAAVDTTTRFYVRGTNTYGCSAVDSIQVIVTASGEARFLVPNAFTPNNDGHNDCIGLIKWATRSLKNLLFTTAGVNAFLLPKIHGMLERAV
jgi:hypothetical protein